MCKYVSSTPALAALLECPPCVPVLGYRVLRPPGEGGVGKSKGPVCLCVGVGILCKTIARELGVINVEMWASGMCAHESVEALRPFSHNCLMHLFHLPGPEIHPFIIN